MYVCVCNAVTDKQIINAAKQSTTKFKDLCNELNVATCCGRCATCAKNIWHEAQNQSCETVAMPIEVVPAFA